MISMRSSLGNGLLLATLFLGTLCTAAWMTGCDDVPADPDAGPEVDAGPVEPISTASCTYEAAPPTAGAGGTVTAGTLQAGVAEGFLDVPLGASLAAYTSRAEAMGREGFLPEPDARRTFLAGSFAPSVGIETAPRVRALSLANGSERALILKLDLASSYQGFVHDVEAELGPEYAGKVIVASSHSHSSFGNYSGHSALAVGFGQFRATVYRAIIEQLVATARAAIAAEQPAQIGFALDPEFDLEDRVNRDRRGENDYLAGGPLDDQNLFLIRVDTAAGEPLAVIPVFGMHGTVQGGDNAFISTDSVGGVERVIEESFDSQVLVMHLQGAAGDVSPAGTGAIDCTGSELCTDFARDETIGMYASDAIHAAWEAAGAAMQTDLEMEMVTRDVPLGPDWRTFTIRDGALSYAPWDGRTRGDGIVYGDDGNLVSPIDEFNAPYGAALCGAGADIGLRLPQSNLPGSDLVRDYSYYYCNRLEEIIDVIGILFDLELETPPICDTTQTTLSALRLGDWMLGTLPGEPVTLLANHLRTLSPLPADHTIVVGYAQDHGGYLLRPEDWLSGGYEPSITFWGPLEGEYVAEQSARVMALAATPMREDGNAEGIAHVITPVIEDDIVLDDTPSAVGTPPASLPAYLATRLLQTPASVQPAATVPRLGTAFFTWIGDDPVRGTARVTLQREVGGVFEDVLRRSGRPVRDADLILTWTPDPIMQVPSSSRTHYYTVEWQAAAPMGYPGLEALADRPGLPLGNYRFRIEGPGYELTSDPFEVVAAELSMTATPAGADLGVTVGYDAPNGYRLLDLASLSNRFVPIRSATMTVTVATGSGPDRVETIDTDGDGNLTVTGVSGATQITIADRFGNQAIYTP